jgi:hypothetical protein
VTFAGIRLPRRIRGVRGAFADFLVGTGLFLHAPNDGEVPGVDNIRMSRRSALAGALAAVPAMRLGAAGAGEIEAPKVSSETAAMLRDIDADRIERTIRKLVSFGTRSTLSSQDDPVRGIGAARDWLLGEYQEISRRNGGRLRGELQSFVQPAGSSRIPVDTVITNVVATLPGTQPESVGRTYVVSGHSASAVRTTPRPASWPGSSRRSASARSGT